MRLAVRLKMLGGFEIARQTAVLRRCRSHKRTTVPNIYRLACLRVVVRGGLQSGRRDLLSVGLRWQALGGKQAPESAPRLVGPSVRIHRQNEFGRIPTNTRFGSHANDERIPAVSASLVRQQDCGAVA
jgi:hypothetical protein